MYALRNSSIAKPLCCFLAHALVLSSCVTVKVDDLTRPRFKEVLEPVYAKFDTTKYTKPDSPIFVDQRQVGSRRPIGLAVFDVWSRQEDKIHYNDSLTNVFFWSLTRTPGFLEKFQPMSPENLKMNFETDTLHYSDQNLLRKIASANFPFVLSIQQINIDENKAEISVLRTGDGASLIRSIVKTTGYSNAFSDAARLLLHEELPTYTQVERVVRIDSLLVADGYYKKEVKKLEPDAEIFLYAGTILLGIVILSAIFGGLR